MLNLRNVRLCYQRMTLRLFLTSSDILLLQTNNITVFVCGILNKGLMENEVLGLCDIHGTHTTLIDKLCNIFLFLITQRLNLNGNRIPICWINKTVSFWTSLQRYGYCACSWQCCTYVQTHKYQNSNVVHRTGMQRESLSVKPCYHG